MADSLNTLLFKPFCNGIQGRIVTEDFFAIKRTNAQKLLVCHGCRLSFVVGDDVVFEAGASRKRYHAACCDKYQIPYDIPEKWYKDREAFDETKKEKDRLNTAQEKPEKK